MTHTLTWLHLSDFHFKPDADWQQDVVLNSLMRDVIQKLPAKNLQPDMVLVTGDIANHGKAAEYTTATTYFNKVAEALNMKPEVSWFLVPGNHDVDRDEIEVEQELGRQLFTAESAANKLVSKPKMWTNYAARQSAFFQFTEDFLGIERAWPANQPWRTDFFPKDHLQVGILCLNSAWLAQDDDDKENLLISEFQVRKALLKAKDAHLRIGLFHHPLSWLRDFDKKKVRGILTGSDYCHLLLNGHLHDPDLTLRAGPGFQTAELAAGACWQGAGWDHSVTVGQLDFTNRQMHLHVFSFSNKKEGHWFADNTLSRDMPNGIWSQPFPTQWTFPKAEEAQKVQLKVALIPQAWRKEVYKQYGHAETLVELDTPRPCRLEDVYVPLKTGWLESTRRMQADQRKHADRDVNRPLAGLTQHPKFRHFVIVGGPGAGKTTFMRHTALQAFQETNTLPLLLPLKEFGSWLSQQKPQGTKPQHLVIWAQEKLSDWGLEDLTPRLGQGQVLWLLDGLDEIFDECLRLQAVQIIHAFTKHDSWGQDRLLLTTRPHALDHTQLRNALGLAHQTAHIMDLDVADQRAFLTGWFKALYSETPEKAMESRDDLWQKMANHPGLEDLRGTPLLLSMIAAIYYSGSSLPERRAELYGKAITNLLERRYGLNARHAGSNRLVREMRHALTTTALWMMEQGAVREIGPVDFTRVLGGASFPENSPDWQRWADVEELAVDLGAHSGLLAMDPKHFRFIHLGFQEYLAALGVVYRDELNNYLLPHFDTSQWREVILLTVGILYESQSSARRGEQLVRTILADGTDCARLAMALEAAAQAPPGELRSLETELKDKAVSILQDPATPHSQRERCDLGLALGHLGDPRLNLNYSGNWIELTKDGKPYRLAKYLTTNQDFKEFIKAGGYTNQDWWDADGLAWLAKNLPNLDERYPEEWWNQRFNAPNQPVVGVSWHEAQAYCRWLTAEFTAWGPKWLPEDWEVRLPNMAEWGHAAGEGSRKYPWGDEEPDATLANFDGKGALGQTSPVGLYPKGVAGGIYDLAGNVWEWNLDEHAEGGQYLRGGSWFYSDQNLASSLRYWYWARYRNQYIGFRCCVAPRALKG